MKNLKIRLAILFTSVNLLNNNAVFSQQINLVESMSDSSKKEIKAEERDHVFI
jgi:hypothetical protein